MNIIAYKKLSKNAKNITFAQKQKLASCNNARRENYLTFTNTPGQLSELAEEAVKYEMIF